MKQAVRDIEFLSDPASGEIKIGCPDGIAVILLPIIESFSRRYPNVVFDVREEEIETLGKKLRDRALDFLVQRLRGPPSHRRLSDVSTWRWRSKTNWSSLRAAKSLGPSPQDRTCPVGRRTLDLERPAEWNHRIVSEAFAAAGLPMPKTVLRTYSLHIRANLVASGRFIATSRNRSHSFMVIGSRSRYCLSIFLFGRGRWRS